MFYVCVLVIILLTRSPGLKILRSSKLLSLDQWADMRLSNVSVRLSSFLIYCPTQPFGIVPFSNYQIEPSPERCRTIRE